MNNYDPPLLAARLEYDCYKIALRRGYLDLVTWPVPEVSGQISFVTALLANLPGPMWEKNRLFIQAAPLPQITGTTYLAASGLPALELAADALLLDSGSRDLGFTLVTWLGQLFGFARQWYDTCRRQGVTRLLNGPRSQDDNARLLAQMAFLLGSTMEELVTTNEETADRLLPALITWAQKPWTLRVLFHQSMQEQPSPANTDLLSVLESLDLHQTPLHLILTDTPVFSDLLSPYTRELRQVLLTWQQENPGLVFQNQAVTAEGEDRLYWILRDFLAQKEALVTEYTRANATCGIVDRQGLFTTPGSYTLIDLSTLEYGLTDPRLLLKNPQKKLSGLLLILPLQDPGCLASLSAVLAADNFSVTSLTLYKRAHTLNGSALQLPMAWIDGLNGQVLNFPAPNMVETTELPGLVSGQVSAGVIASLPGSYWVNGEIEAALENQRLAIAYDQDGCQLINTILTTLLKSHRLTPNWSWRALYYQNPAPFEESSYRQGVNESAALENCYGGACAILRSLIGSRAKTETATAPRPQAKSSSSGFRLRV